MFVAVIQVTLTNVAQKSKLLWVHAVATYFVVFIILRVSPPKSKATKQLTSRGLSCVSCQSGYCSNVEICTLNTCLNELTLAAACPV